MTPQEFKDIRILKGMTQRQFAEFLGIGYRTVQRCESGQREIKKPIIKLLELLTINNNKGE